MSALVSFLPFFGADGFFLLSPRLYGSLGDTAAAGRLTAGVGGLLGGPPRALGCSGGLDRLMASY